MRSNYILAVFAASFASAGSVKLATFIDPDESAIHYTVVGNLPSGWVFSAQPNDLSVGGAFFQTYRLISITPTSMMAQCNWYEYADSYGRSLKRTSFTSLVDPSSMMYNVYKKGFNLNDKPRWLQTLDAFCMFKTPEALVSTVTLRGSAYYPAEMSEVFVTRIQTSLGKWTAKVAKR